MIVSLKSAHVVGYLQLTASESSTSNTQELDIPLQDIAYFYHPSGNHTVAILIPKIDTIAFTATAKAAFGYLSGANNDSFGKYWEEFPKRLIDCANSEDFPEIEPYKGKAKIVGYTAQAFFRIAEGKRVLVCANDGTKSAAPLRMEFSASKIFASDLEALAAIWSLVDLGNLPFSSLWKDARVTRLDIACDIINLDISDLYVLGAAVSKMWSASTNETGVQTIQYYRGKSSSAFVSPRKRADLLVYDKRAEQIARGVVPVYGAWPHTRVEASLAKKCLLSSLHAQKDPFAKWNFVETLSIPPDERWIWRLFFDSVRSRGWEKAKELVPKAHWEKAMLLKEEYFGNALFGHHDFTSAWPAAVQKCAVGQLLEWALKDFSELLPGIEGQLFIS